MAEYAQQEETEIARQQALADEGLKGSREAPQHSDNYVLATVLFFGGIARAFDSGMLRSVLTALAIVLFLVTLAGVLTLPICHE
jgi:hypothetical protein